MAVELFLIPMEDTGSRIARYRPKYVTNAAVVACGAIRSSRVDGEAVTMINAPQTYLNTVAGQADVLRLATADNIDNTLTNNQANVAKAFFEGRGIPGEFINQGDTRRHAIREVCGLFLFCQRMEGRFGYGFKQRAIEQGITFATQFQNMPQAVRDEFLAIRDDHGWGNLGLTNTSTLRQIMIAITAQFATRPIFIGGVEI